ncbi:hypothetical protein FSP39_025380 [Pinctada imbricata]|uniref:Integrase catalytic domain-containing protein n=1 Tax=Pinctada imbricata TaxID=66713 RepID=A0AA89CCE4_PINIB|nr:hypothetical protein FSP39_025380 [Pinctada imbricata]
MTDREPEETQVAEGTQATEDRDVDPQRVRSLTGRGQSAFDEQFNKLQEVFKTIWKEMEDLMVNFDTEQTDRKYLHDVEKNLNSLNKKLISSSENIQSFLGKARTQQASRLLDMHSEEYCRRSKFVYTFRDSVNAKLLEAAEALSEKFAVRAHHSEKFEVGSHHSSRASQGSEAQRKRAKAEAQMARLKYLEEQAAIEKRKADIELNLSKEKEKAAVQMAEVKALEAEETYEDDMHKWNAFLEREPYNSRERTQQYVDTHANFMTQTQGLPVNHLNPTNISEFANVPSHLPFNLPPQQSAIQDMSNFLLKKDLLMHRFSQFDDSPINYSAWKAGFKSIINELKATPVEELDLLTKWLGTESKKFAISIRAANVYQPTQGVALIWNRLEDRFGKPEMVEASLKAKLRDFPRVTDSNPERLYDLLDLLHEINSNMSDSRYSGLLSYYDTSSGVLPIVSKLTNQLQEKWANRASQYKRTHKVPFPPFVFFIQFMQEMCELKNDPGLRISQRSFSNTGEKKKDGVRLVVRKSSLEEDETKQKSFSKRCPIHKSEHSLEKCRLFLGMTLSNKREFLKSKELCFRCCKGKHRAKNCRSRVKCETCNSNRHITCMHPEGEPPNKDGGETTPKEEQSQQDVVTKCTQLCGSDTGSRSCGKVILVNVYPKGQPNKATRMYALIDDQSNKTLATSKFFDIFNLQGDPRVFTLSSCSGSVTFSSRTAEDFIVEPLSGEVQIQIPRIIELDGIPNNRQEIPTPDVALAYPYMSDISPFIPEKDQSADILLLIGRDVIQAHHVLDQRMGPDNSPFAQKLHLGWTIIGEVCLKGTHRPKDITVRKTHLLSNGRNTLLEPCEAQFSVKDETLLYSHDVFHTTRSDEKPGLSSEDREFLDIMTKELHTDIDGKWTAPLPFRPNRPRLPNNHGQALRRAMILDASLKKDPTKRDHAVEFMRNIIEKGHAEPAPPLRPEEECWYLPIFGIYHPMKPGKIRMVFDSSAKFQDISLNSVLLTGPDLTNSLIGVLMRFRMDKIAVTADIEHMFHCFGVSEKHRNYLRFLWYTDNDTNKPLMEYRMKVHVFGNTTSPAVATYGLRQAALTAEPIYGTDMREFVERNFYVDDALVSLPSASNAIDLIQRTQEALMANGNLRLHKIASNDHEVMENFPARDLAKELIDLDLTKENLPSQRSLGLVWDLQEDAFGFKVNLQEKPFTRRGVLSCINSLYDPLGFISPVSIKGKLLLREMIQTPCVDWDDPLPDEYLSRWLTWTRSLSLLEAMKIPRSYLPIGFSELKQKRVLIFTDASELAIASVAYLYDVSESGNINLGFIMGKAKVAPKPATSIPRLELCAAVLGVEIATIIRDQLDISYENFSFFTDSRIVLGYIYNRSRRFLIYVSNRVQRILNFAPASHWNYVPSEHNPADHGTKHTYDRALYDSWLSGPLTWLRSESDLEKDSTDTFDLIDPESDKEVKQEIQAMKSEASDTFLWGPVFEKFPSWKKLVSFIAMLKSFIRRRKDISVDTDPSTIRKDAEKFIIRQTQRECFEKEISALRTDKPLPKNSSVSRLNPYLDSDGLLCVGGRLSHAEIDVVQKYPLLIPGSHYIAKLLVLHYHRTVYHQGRHFTEGAIRNAGFWITSAKRLVSSIIYKCVQCRRIRGKLLSQKMADLPPERLKSSPPFTYVGVDCFGPWTVSTRRTRGGSAESKRWAVLFTCMCSRAVHIEILEQMTTASFINALRRFYAIRGNVKEFFSDRGTNFVGCCNTLGIPAINVEDPSIKDFLSDKETVWKFNTPFSSNMGGAWERLIGVTRRILDAMLYEVRHTKLTHEVLTTFFAEVTAIINNRPLVALDSDAESPFVLTPNILLTQKTEDVCEVPMNLDVRDLYSSQWKFVQVLAQRFWDQWRKQYLQSLQPRKKWTDKQPNIEIGDIVLLKDEGQHRNNWPIGRVSQIFPSRDNLVRKVEITTFRNGTKRSYIRPITQVVLLVGSSE